ncbi:MAG: ISL3 family transposase [Planctomycetes bacterium]|nr:ISL3 family transposase [Planctomycetota bacterium]
MSAKTFLHNAYNIQGFDVVRQEWEYRKGYFRLRHKPNILRCPECRCWGVKKNGVRRRTIRLPPVGRKQVFAVLDVQRIICRGCGYNGQCAIHFAEARKSYSKGFERYVHDLLEFGDIDHISKHLGVGWDMVKDIDKARLKRLYDKPSLKNVAAIAIDEFYAGRKTGYYTFVLDLASGAIVHVGQGKDGDALKGFWKRLGRRKSQIRAVAMDMSKAFIAAVRENLPEADLVFDPFHVVKLMNEKIDQIRRDLCRELQDDVRPFVKGNRWLLLKGAENLSTIPNPKRADNKSEVRLLQEALDANKPLATAYYLKEDLRRLWDFRDADAGAAFLDGWIGRASATELEPLQKMAQTLTRHRQGILAYFKHRITSGPMEATNNKIRVLQRQTYGLRDREYWELCVKSLHRNESRLVSTG